MLLDGDKSQRKSAASYIRRDSKFIYGYKEFLDEIVAEPDPLERHKTFEKIEKLLFAIEGEGKNKSIPSSTILCSLKSLLSRLTQSR
jgi:hypothetical protein